MPRATRSSGEIRRSHTEKRREENRAIKETRIMSWNSIQGCLADFAVCSAIERINHQPDDQPDEQAPPGFRRQAQHGSRGRENAENGHQGNQRRLERTWKIRAFPAENP